jgi:hypothetical protein
MLSSVLREKNFNVRQLSHAVRHNLSGPVQYIQAKLELAGHLDRQASNRYFAPFELAHSPLDRLKE